MTRRSHRCSFPTSGGLQLAGILEMPSEAPVGSIVFSHCFTCNKDLKAIVWISRELALLGWAVLRFDFRGLGQSEGEFSNSNFTTNLEDLSHAVEYVRSLSMPVDFLIGHSFGGAASLALAQTMESIRGVIALAAPSDTHHLARLLESMAPSLSDTGCGEVTIGGFRYKIHRAMLEDFRRYDLPKRLEELTKPLLALHSRADETVAYWNAVRNCQFSCSSERPHLRSLVTLPDCNHLLTDQNICRSVAQIVNIWCRHIAMYEPTIH